MMTQAEKLEALVQAGFDRAWEFDNLDKWQFKAVHKTDTVRTDWYQVIFTHGVRTVVIDAERIIFDPLLAAALFGRGPDCAYCGEPPKNMHQPRCIEGSNIWPYLFEYHLQQAVISKDPIDYMYKAVFDDDRPS